MAFFDDCEDLDEILDSELNQVETFFAEGSQIGSLVYYDPLGFMFMTASSDGSSMIDVHNIKDWRTITIGTVINEYEDGTIDALMCGFLMAEPLRLPIMYYHEDKKRYIKNYAKDMFRRFVSAFFKQVPAYNDLLKLVIDMPTVSDMLYIKEHFSELFTSLSVCTDAKKFIDYITRLRDNYIYVMHKKKMYMMRLGKEDEQPDIIHPEAHIRADFLCVFRHIKLNDRSTYDNLNKSVEQFISEPTKTESEQDA